MTRVLERITFYSIIFLFISQFGKHFWPTFAYVAGIRVDYLSPTLYLTDILIGILFVLYCLRIRFKFDFSTLSIHTHVFVFLSVLVLLIPLFFAESVPAHIYGVVKIAEFAFFAWYVARNLERRDIRLIVLIFSAAASVVSIIGIIQFINQSAIGGPLYFLGERSFTASTIGIAVAHVRDTVMLRPYATFPHPNVFAFFLLCSILFSLLYLPFERNKFVRYALIAAGLLSTLALFLTFSRIIILCLLMFAGWFILKKRLKFNKLLLISTSSILLIFCIYAYFFGDRFTNIIIASRDLFLRFELLQIAYQIWLNSPFFGVGLNNFFLHEIVYQKSITPTLLQPVHNIYAYVLVQLGIAGLGIFVYGLFLTLQRLLIQLRKTKGETHSFYLAVFLLVLSALAAGLFDHFFLTVQQGQLMFAFLIGAAWGSVLTVKD